MSMLLVLYSSVLENKDSQQSCDYPMMPAQLNYGVRNELG